MAARASPIHLPLLLSLSAGSTESLWLANAIMAALRGRRIRLQAWELESSRRLVKLVRPAGLESEAYDLVQFNWVGKRGAGLHPHFEPCKNPDLSRYSAPLWQSRGADTQLGAEVCCWWGVGKSAAPACRHPADLIFDCRQRGYIHKCLAWLLSWEIY